jgi:uncharacterized membrane protein YidH (DUF202 family)
MKSTTLIGAVLVVIGILALAYQGFTYTTQKKVLDLGPIHATREENHTIPLPPIIGMIALVGGVVVLVAGQSKP